MVPCLACCSNHQHAVSPLLIVATTDVLVVACGNVRTAPHGLCVQYEDAIWHAGDMPDAAAAGEALHARFNEVLKLDFLLFKYIEKPIYQVNPVPLGVSNRWGLQP